MSQTQRLIKFKYRATLKVSFFLPSMWKFLAPPTMLRAKCGLGLWIKRSTEKLKKRKTEKLLKRFWGKWWLHRRSPQCSARKSFTLFIVVLSASRTYLWYFYYLFRKVIPWRHILNLCTILLGLRIHKQSSGKIDDWLNIFQGACTNLTALPQLPSKSIWPKALEGCS